MLITQASMPILAVAIGGLALAASMTAVIMVDTSLPSLAAPGLDPSQQVEGLRFELAPIGAFEAYYGRQGQDAWADLNPFVPYPQRQAEQAALQRQPPQEVVTVLPPPPTAPPDEVVTPAPELSLPALQLAEVAQPEVLGLVTLGGVTVLRVRIGGGTIQRLQPGDVIAGWRLIDGDGRQARFESPSGRLENIPVGVRSESAGGGE